MADDEFYRSIFGTLRDVPRADRWTFPIRSVGINCFTRGRLRKDGGDIQLRSDLARWSRGGTFHLVDDELLASAKSILLIDAELIGRVVFDLTDHPDQVAAISRQIATALQERRAAIDHFMREARLSLTVPPSFTPGARTDAIRGVGPGR